MPAYQTAAIYSITHDCRQEEQTAQVAQALALGLSQFLQQHPNHHLNLALEGELGAGKTTFARHLIHSMGYLGRVKSPTYTLCEPYPLKLNHAQSTDTSITAHHFDLYRMRDPLEWQEAGFVEHFDAPGFCLIEWPEKAEGTLPTMDIEIQIAAGQTEEERIITLNAYTELGQVILLSEKK